MIRTVLLYFRQLGTVVREEFHREELEIHRCRALALVVVSLASNVRASIISYTVTGSVPPTATNWSSSITVPQFDTNRGTLQSVTLNLGGSMSTTLTAGNISYYVPPTQPSSGSASSVVQVTLQDSGGSLTGTPQLTFMSPFETYNLSDGTFNASGTTDSWSHARWVPAAPSIRTRTLWANSASAVPGPSRCLRWGMGSRTRLILVAPATPRKSPTLV